MYKQTTLSGGLAKEKNYFRQEPRNLYENFVEAYYYFDLTKNETKE